MNKPATNPGFTYKDAGDVVGAAFHGTSLASGKEIEKSGFYLPEKATPDQRMGKGVCFWEGSERAARRWAKLFFPSEPHCSIAARLKLGKHLNLCTTEGQEAFKAIAQFLIKDQGISEIYEGQVFNFFVSKFSVDSARRIHEWADQQKLLPGVENAWATGPSDTIICVYTTRLIEAPCIAWTSN